MIKKLRVWLAEVQLHYLTSEKNWLEADFYYCKFDGFQPKIDAINAKILIVELRLKRLKAVQP